MKLPPKETGQKTFQTNNSLTQNNIKDLSIQISLSGLSFCILNRSSNTIEFLKNQLFDKKANPFETLEYLKKYLESFSELNQSFSSVLVIFQNELSNIVPKAFFDEKQSADYLKFNSKILTSDYISHDEIAINESINVYVPYVNINNVIFDIYGAFEYKHAATILIDSILQNHSKADETELYLNINSKHFELIALKNKKLLLYNSFEYSTKEDVIYYLLFTMEQLHLNPETVKLQLIGRIDTNDEMYTIIYTYIRFVTFYNPSYNFEFKSGAKPLQQHHNAIILNSF